MNIIYLSFYQYHSFIFTFHGFIWNRPNDQLPVGLLAQLVERCTGIAEVIGIGVRAGGARGAAAPPKFGQLRCFGQQEKFGQSQFLKKFLCFFFRRD